MTLTKSLIILAAAASAAACGEAVTDGSAPEQQIRHVGDPESGRQLFADKGCVICHAVNGVGGKAAPALDARTQMDPADPVDFAARMWRGAPAMVELQSLELGYAIYLDTQEIVDLAAFAADAEEQKKLQLSDIDEGLAASFLDQQFWEFEDWEEFLRHGQEGAGEPPPDDEPGQ